MPATPSASERKLKRAVLERDQARDENERLKKSLAEVRKRMRLVSRDLSESLQHRTATGDVLRIVSRSVADTQPVFDAILASVLALFKGFDATVWMVEGEYLRPVARGGATQNRGKRNVPIAEDVDFVALVEQGKAYCIDDTSADTHISEARRQRMLSRGRMAHAGVPLLRQGRTIGIITISNTQPTRFTEGQMALLQNFADQAVIAIENARLFNELEASNREQAETLRYQAAKFKQVMLNLLSNAVKFTPQGGKITVTAKRGEAGLEVSVTDTGVGIAPADQQTVFEEFKQVGKDTKKKAEGTGLGLALTKKFVELHGGQIGLASEPGKGSTFSFTLPEKGM